MHMSVLACRTCMCINVYVLYVSVRIVCMCMNESIVCMCMNDTYRYIQIHTDIYNSYIYMQYIQIHTDTCNCIQIHIMHAIHTNTYRYISYIQVHAHTDKIHTYTYIYNDVSCISVWILYV